MFPLSCILRLKVGCVADASVCRLIAMRCMECVCGDSVFTVPHMTLRLQVLTLLDVAVVCFMLRWWVSLVVWFSWTDSANRSNEERALGLKRAGVSTFAERPTVLLWLWPLFKLWALSMRLCERDVVTSHSETARLVILNPHGVQQLGLTAVKYKINTM